jgi:hypothetical protein
VGLAQLSKTDKQLAEMLDVVTDDPDRPRWKQVMREQMRKPAPAPSRATSPASSGSSETATDKPTSISSEPKYSLPPERRHVIIARAE